MAVVTEASAVNPLNSCRLCLSRGPTIRILNTNVADAIRMLYNVVISDNDDSSKLICFNCLRFVQLWRKNSVRTSTVHEMFNYIRRHRRLPVSYLPNHTLPQPIGVFFPMITKFKRPYCPGKYPCKDCSYLCDSVHEYVNHSMRQHRKRVVPKDNLIRLCPLCEQNILNEVFNSHIYVCTRSMEEINEARPTSEMKTYNCKYCKLKFTSMPSNFRSHLLYCKSILEIVDDGALSFICRYCTFKSRSHEEASQHARGRCIYFQLKTRYAMNPYEGERALGRD